MLVGNSPERRYGASKRLGSSAKERRGCGESHRALAGDGTARRTVGDEDPRRRRWLVAEAVVHRSGRLGVTSNGLRWVRRTSGRRLLAPAGLQGAARRRTEAEAMVRRESSRCGLEREREGCGRVIWGAARARERRERLETGRARSRGAEKAEVRGASERENRRAVEDDADRRARGVSGGETRADRSGGSDRTIGPSDATLGRGRERDGPGGEGGKGQAGPTERERKRGKEGFGPGRNFNSEKV